MENKLPLHFTMFNNKVKLMNQSNAKELTLSAQEARNLHSDLFELLNQYHYVTRIPKIENPTKEVNLNMDGGSF